MSRLMFLLCSPLHCEFFRILVSTHHRERDGRPVVSTSIPAACPCVWNAPERSVPFTKMPAIGVFFGLAAAVLILWKHWPEPMQLGDPTEGPEVHLL